MDLPSDIAAILKALKGNGFDAHFTPTALEAKDMILGMIELNARIGIADSVTLRQIGLLDELSRKGYTVNNPFTPEMTAGIHNNPDQASRFIGALRKTFQSDILITSSNAVTEDGNLVSIDGAGNRVAGTIYGAPHVILAIGRNKIVKNTSAAIDRIKNVIAPAHAAQKRYKTPCAKTGKCADCNSPDRICSVTVILEKKPYHTNISVILIGEDVGLGWDPEWDKRRIENIRDNYIKYSWPF